MMWHTNTSFGGACVANFLPPFMATVTWIIELSSFLPWCQRQEVFMVCHNDCSCILSRLIWDHKQNSFCFQIKLRNVTAFLFCIGLTGFITLFICGYVFEYTWIIEPTSFLPGCQRQEVFLVCHNDGGWQAWFDSHTYRCAKWWNI